MADTPPNSTAAAPKAPLKAPANATVNAPVKAPEATSTTASSKPTPTTKSRLKRAFSLARWALAIVLIVAITLFVLARNNALPQGLQTALSATTHTVSTAWRALFNDDADAWQAYIDAQFETLDAAQTAWQNNAQQDFARAAQTNARTLQETETALAALRREAYANSVLIDQWKGQLAAPESLTAIARHQVGIMQYQLAFGYAPNLVAAQIGHFLDFLRAHNAPNFNAIYEELRPIQQELSETPTPQVAYWLRELDLAKRSLPLWLSAQNPTRNDNGVPAQNADTPNTPNASNNLWARIGHIGQSLVRIEKAQAPSMGGIEATNAEYIALLAAHRLDYLQLSLLGLNLAQAQLQSAELLRFLDTYLYTNTQDTKTDPGLNALTDTLQAINAYDTQAANAALTNTLNLLTPQNTP